MKKITSILALTMLFVLGTAFNSCTTSAQREAALAKAEADKEAIMVAQRDSTARAQMVIRQRDSTEKAQLAIRQRDSVIRVQRAADAEAWRALKTDSELKIRNNEMRIAEVKESLKALKKTADSISTNRIATLEQRNKDLRTRMEEYERSQSPWEIFKRDFTRDMDELGQSLRDISINKRK
jgi:hypothetical protein